jgi:hypothetical protein
MALAVVLLAVRELALPPANCAQSYPPADRAQSSHPANEIR